MKTLSESEVTLAVDQVGEPTISARRRRLIAGGGAVLMSLHARTVLGQTACQSPSGNFSGNTSPRPGGVPASCQLGRSPGFWKQPQHFGDWVGALPPTFAVPIESPCFLGQGEIKKLDITDPGTQFSALFGTAPDVGLWQVLAFPDLYPALARHCAAAYLNANSSLFYPVRPDQVIAMWQGGNNGTGYCPIGPGGCAMATWDAAKIIAYIESTYSDFGEPTLCKKNDPYGASVTTTTRKTPAQ